MLFELVVDALTDKLTQLCIVCTAGNQAQYLDGGRIVAGLLRGVPEPIQLAGKRPQVGALGHVFVVGGLLELVAVVRPTKVAGAQLDARAGVYRADAGVVNNAHAATSATTLFSVSRATVRPSILKRTR